MRSVAFSTWRKPEFSLSLMKNHSSTHFSLPTCPWIAILCSLESALHMPVIEQNGAATTSIQFFRHSTHWRLPFETTSIAMVILFTLRRAIGFTCFSVR